MHLLGLMIINDNWVLVLDYGEAGCEGETGCAEGAGSEEETGFTFMSAFKTRLTEGFFGSLVKTFTDLVI